MEKLLFAVVSCLFFANLASPQDSSIPTIPWPDRQVWPESPRTAHYELADYQGNITDVVDSRGNIVSHTGYYPYGQPWRRPADMQRLYGGKEWLGADGRDEYDFHGRRHAPHLALGILELGCSDKNLC